MQSGPVSKKAAVISDDLKVETYTNNLFFVIFSKKFQTQVKRGFPPTLSP
jgi:hypothetical protein